MPIVAQGGLVTLRGQFGHAGSGSPADAPDATLTIVDSLGATVSGFPVAIPPIVRDDIGAYHYAWSVPIAQAIDSYVATWSGTVDGATATGSELVEVVAVGGVVTDTYCSLSDVKQRASGDLPNMGTQYDAVITAKCVEQTAAIDRMVGQARGIRGAWSFVADATASARYFTGKAGGSRLLPIDDCVAITSVVEGGVTLVAGTDYVLSPLQGTPIVGLLRLSGTWSTTPADIVVTARWGYGTVVPDDVREVAILEVIRSFRADQAGNNDVVGVTPFGTAQVTKAYSSRLMQLVSDYSMGGGFLR